jgi:hypothetical protein
MFKKIIFPALAYGQTFLAPSDLGGFAGVSTSARTVQNYDCSHD